MTATAWPRAEYPRPEPAPSDPWPMYAASYRLAQRAADNAVQRDATLSAEMREHHDSSALHYAAAACIAADAGLCDIATAIDYDTAREITGSARPGVDYYRAAVLAAVRDNR